MRCDVPTGHGAEQTIARQVTPHRLTGHTPRSTTCSQQIGQGRAVFAQHTGLCIDVQAPLGMEQGASDLDGMKRRFQGTLESTMRRRIEPG